MPTLRGISKTGPYWHHNISETLEAVVEPYSDHLLAKVPSLTINNEPPEPDEDGDIGPVEAMSKQQKRDLVAFLKRL
jgi:cytochrome c peroxidase